MARLIIAIIFTTLLFTGFSFAKGFKVGGFKSYKSYKSQSTLKHGNEPISQKYDTTKLKNKNLKTVKSSQNMKKPSFLNNPIFKWFIGGMIFGAILSMLLGYGFHIGMPGLLEILLIVGLIYIIYKSFKKKEYAHG